jgi:hypothetical protein
MDQPTRGELLLWPVAIALFAFALDWSGFDKSQPDLFFPKPFSEVWWHLPLFLAGLLLAFFLAAGILKLRDALNRWRHRRRAKAGSGSV